MKLVTMFAGFAAAAIGAASTVALAQNTPPTPRPAAGALPQTAVKAENRGHRTQTAEEQKAAQSSPAISPNSSRSRK